MGPSGCWVLSTETFLKETVGVTIMTIVASLGFALSIICLVECVACLFPKAASTGQSISVVLLALACILLGFVSVDFMNTHEDSFSRISWIVSVTLLVTYVIIRSAFTFVRQTHGHQQHIGDNNQH